MYVMDIALINTTIGSNAVSLPVSVPVIAADSHPVLTESVAALLEHVLVLRVLIPSPRLIILRVVSRVLLLAS